MTNHPGGLDALPARLTVQQAADAMQVSVKTIRRWYGGGRVKAYRMGDRMVRVDRDSLLKLAEKPLTHRSPARNNRKARGGAA